VIRDLENITCEERLKEGLSLAKKDIENQQHRNCLETHEETFYEEKETVILHMHSEQDNKQWA